MFPHETDLSKVNRKTWPLQGTRIWSRTLDEKYQRNKTAFVFMVSPLAQFLKTALYFILEFKSWKTSAHLLPARLSDATENVHLLAGLVWKTLRCLRFSPLSTNEAKGIQHNVWETDINKYCAVHVAKASGQIQIRPSGVNYLHYIEKPKHRFIFYFPLIVPALSHNDKHQLLTHVIYFLTVFLCTLWEALGEDD